MVTQFVEKDHRCGRKGDKMSRSTLTFVAGVTTYIRSHPRFPGLTTVCRQPPVSLTNFCLSFKILFVQDFVRPSFCNYMIARQGSAPKRGTSAPPLRCFDETRAGGSGMHEVSPSEDQSTQSASITRTVLDLP